MSAFFFILNLHITAFKESMCIVANCMPVNVFMHAKMFCIVRLIRLMTKCMIIFAEYLLGTF